MHGMEHGSTCAQPHRRFAVRAARAAEEENNK